MNSRVEFAPTTKEEALTEREFHAPALCINYVGPRGGIVAIPALWRVNGRPKTWKTNPDAFRVPLKSGIHSYAYLNPTNAEYLCPASRCPVCTGEPTRRDS